MVETVPRTLDQKLIEASLFSHQAGILERRVLPIVSLGSPIIYRPGRRVTRARARDRVMRVKQIFALAAIF